MVQCRIKYNVYDTFYVIARRNDEAIQELTAFLDCFVPRSDVKRVISFIVYSELVHY